MAQSERRHGRNASGGGAVTGSTGNPAQPRPILLDAYAARNCPVKVQNRYDRTVKLPGSDDDSAAMRSTSEGMAEIFAGSAGFRDLVLSAVAAAGVRVVDLRGLADADWPDREAVTAEVIAEGAEVIVKPTLPVDHAGHRFGSPDLLVRGPDRPDGSPGYYPAHVKRTRLLARPSGFSGATVLISNLDSPTPAAAVDLPLTLRSSPDLELIQLAHYWRMLEAAGWTAGGTPTAGLIGRDSVSELLTGQRGDLRYYELPPAADLALTWLDLTAKTLRTLSRTAAPGWRLRAALERYDHEHQFRVKVAEVASRRVGGADDPSSMVQPIVIKECQHCQWWLACRPMLGSDDISLRIDKARLDVREIAVLRSMGINTIHDLRAADLEALLASYLPEVRHRPHAEERLRTAAHRSRLLAEGIELDRCSSGPIQVPRASIEVDLDIETSADNRVYLWGFLVQRPDEQPRYVSFARFADISLAEEASLAIEAMEWLLGILTEHPDALIYHYSDYEVVHIRRLADFSDDPVLRRVCDEALANFVDLFQVIRDNFFGTHGLGLKQVASAAAGFRWRDDDPGGLNSQRWFVDAVHGADEQIRADAATRILEYNEDDVRATNVVRRWLSDLD